METIQKLKENGKLYLPYCDEYVKTAYYQEDAAEYIRIVMPEVEEFLDCREVVLACREEEAMYFTIELSKDLKTSYLCAWVDGGMNHVNFGEIRYRSSGCMERIKKMFNEQ